MISFFPQWAENADFVNVLEGMAKWENNPAFDVTDSEAATEAPAA
jgi:hypothetical protein